MDEQRVFAVVERDAVMRLADAFLREAPSEIDDGAGDVETAAGGEFSVGEIDDPRNVRYRRFIVLRA